MAANPASRMTLGRHIVECQRQHPRARGELSVLLIQLAVTGKIFSHALHRAALTGDLGLTGDDPDDATSLSRRRPAQ